MKRLRIKAIFSHVSVDMIFITLLLRLKTFGILREYAARLMRYCPSLFVDGQSSVPGTWDFSAPTTFPSGRNTCKRGVSVCRLCYTLRSPASSKAKVHEDALRYNAWVFKLFLYFTLSFIESKLRIVFFSSTCKRGAKQTTNLNLRSI